MSPLIPSAAEYKSLLSSIKVRVRTSQVRASLSVNRELVLLYWEIGRDILSCQSEQGWDAKVIDQLSKDLRRTFPEMKGFSTRNLKHVRAIAVSWPEPEIVQQLVAQFPWGHVVLVRILDKVSEPQGWLERKF